MTPTQFDALVKLLRLRSSPTLDAVRMHLVDGLGQTDAARQAGADVLKLHVSVQMRCAHFELEVRGLAQQRCALAYELHGP